MPIHAIHDVDILKTKGTDIKFETLSYCQEHINREILIRLQSSAFRSLCRHLRERSDEVQNIDLMALSGFCRNCLAKVRATHITIFLVTTFMTRKTETLF